MKKILIIGYGSIGRRHSDIFKKLGADVAIVSRQLLSNEKHYACIDKGLKDHTPEIVLITNETFLHEETIRELDTKSFNGVVIVEKPLADKPFNIKHHFSGLYVSYNFRLNPILNFLKRELSKKKIVTANIYCGQYLPDWRPTRDYRETYSAYKNRGGGVIRDLSHELDYAQWLLGPLTSLAAHGGHFSSLEIDSDDNFTIIGTSNRCSSICISVNYLDRVPKRSLIFNTNEETYSADLIKGLLYRNDEIIMSTINSSESYTIQANCILTDKLDDLCTFEEATSVLKLIEAAELSSKIKRSVML